MEYIGTITQKPSMNKAGKWNHLDIFYASSEEFNEATSKMMEILYKNHSDGRCVVSDDKGVKYRLDLVHSTYDTINNVIRVFPVSAHQIVEHSQIKNKKTNKDE